LAMMRSVLLLVAICGAHAKMPWQVQNGMENVHTMIEKLPAAARDVFAQVAPDSRRDDGLTPAQCEQMTSMDAATMKQALNSQAPDSCFNGMMSLLKTMCTPACQKSPLFKTESGSENGAGRRLLGGASTGSASASCKDPCFAPFMQSVVGYLKSSTDPACKDMIPNSNSTRRNMGRALLGGDSMTPEATTKMEMSFGMLCTKNAKGGYCMDLIEKLGNETKGSPSAREQTCAKNCTETTGNSIGSECKKESCPSCNNNIFQPSCKACAIGANGCGGCVDCERANNAMCGMSSGEKDAIKNFGCCYGTMIAIAGLADDNGPDVAEMSRQISNCGVEVSTLPCAMTGIKQTQVVAQTTLSGVTVAQFDSSAQTAFKTGMAKTIGVDSQKVTISSFKAATVRRATGLEVDTQVLLTGDAVDTASAVKTKMADKSLLTTNIKAAAPTGSSLKSATVASSSGTVSATVGGEISASGMAAQAPLATLLVCLAAALLQ